MKKLKDCFGYSVRVTDERLAHILDHPEMKEMEVEIAKVVQQPQIVRRSRSDANSTAVLRVLSADDCAWQMALRCG
jgi:hypothetical protein